ncbi:Lactose transport system permease protein LacF [Phycisphaerae bacterium RAS1]|nr:Lactose transport system permease protein LacF [Phycisphaerae bacterium RAS1]
MTQSRSLLAGLIWTSPWWLGFLIFLLAPMAFSLYISFCNYSMLQPPVYVGMANYSELLRDEVFHKVVANTFLFAAIIIPASTVLSILLAVLLNQPVRGQAIFRACIFVPTIVPLVAAGVVWMWMLNPQYGLVNQLIRTAGLEGPVWLESPQWAMSALVLVSLWLIGSPVVIYLAGLQEIPQQLYEAAELDGAGPVGRFRHVTLPSLSPVILFNVIIGLIGALQVFAVPFLMWRTRAGPDRAVYFYTMYLYDNAFRYLKMGYASAMAWIQLALILALTGLIFWASRRAVHYSRT